MCVHLSSSTMSTSASPVRIRSSYPSSRPQYNDNVLPTLNCLIRASQEVIATGLPTERRMRASGVALKLPTSTFSPTTTGGDLITFLRTASEFIHASPWEYSKEDVAGRGEVSHRNVHFKDTRTQASNAFPRSC